MSADDLDARSLPGGEPNLGPLLTVHSIATECEDARTFEMHVPDGLRARYRGHAGQFVRVTIPGDGTHLSRCYSLSSTPELDEPLRFTVKRVAGGAVSVRLLERMQGGQALHVQPPAGAFRLHAGAQAPLLLIAGGSGITPIYSLLKAALHTTTRMVRLFWADRNEACMIFARQIAELEQRFPQRLRVTRHCSDRSGLPTAADLLAFINVHTHAQVYACGPGPLMDLAEATLDGCENQPGYELFCERFVAASPKGRSPSIPSDSQTRTRVTLSLDGCNYAFDWNGAGSLLDAALAAEVPAPHSCREGHCGACKARLLEGAVDHGDAEALSRRDRTRGNILLCRAVPRTPRIAVAYE